MMATENIEETSADHSHPSTDSPFDDVTKTFSSPLRRKFDKISDLKISSPLLPVEMSEPPTKKAKSVSFAEEIQTLMPQQDPDNVSTDPFDAADQALAAMTAMVEPLVQSAMEQASNERLVEADTTVRVEVPPIEDIVSHVLWADYRGQDQALLRETKSDVTRTDKRWSGASSLERQLPWSPFPTHLGKLKPEGDFDDGSLARYMSELDLETCVDVRQMVWKPEGLRILDLELDDEEELEPCKFKEQVVNPEYDAPFHGTQVANMSSQNPTKSLHFTSSQLPETINSRIPQTKATDPHVPRIQPNQQDTRSAAPESVAPKMNSMQALLEKRRVQLELDKATLDASLLSNANLTKTEEASIGKKLEASSKGFNLSTFMAVQGVPAIPQKQVPQAKQAEAITKSKRLEPVPTPSKPKLEIPAPQITISKARLPIVVSSAIMANRPFLRKLQQHLPTLAMIERESTSPNTKYLPNSIPAREEADLTLSTSTGLLLTTLQKLKQKSLPGQETSFIGIREQFARVAPRYERLIILVSEGSHSAGEPQTHIRTLDARDAAAIADFIGYFSRLEETEVQVSYIPGGEEDLVKWIAAAVTRWAPCLQGFNLLDEETVWENFLRKAGMNAFAAQVVLDQLKTDSSQIGGDEEMGMRSEGFERQGLAAFVRMGVEERVQRFGALIGGEGMLRRVSMAVDGSWNGGVRGT